MTMSSCSYCRQEFKSYRDAKNIPAEAAAPLCNVCGKSHDNDGCNCARIERVNPDFFRALVDWSRVDPLSKYGRFLLCSDCYQFYIL